MWNFQGIVFIFYFLNFQICISVPLSMCDLLVDARHERDKIIVKLFSGRITTNHFMQKENVWHILQI